MRAAFGVLADPDFGPIFFYSESDTSTFITLGANQHNIGQINRGFKLNNTSPHLSTARLNRSLVLFDHIDTLHDDPLFARQNTLNNSASTPLITRDHFDSVTSFYSEHRYHTPLQHFRC
jgi:hypothetical protein